MRTCLSFPLAVLGVCFMLGSPSLAGKGGKPPPAPPADPAIAYRGGSGGALWVMNLDGSNKTSIFDEGFVQGPSFSPGGSELAFLSDTQGSGVYVVGVDGGTSRMIAAKTSPYLGGGSSWSSHGWIAFNDAESPSSNSTEEIFVVRPDGSGLMNLTNTPGRAEFSPSWNAAGDMLAVKAYNVPGTLAQDPVIVYSIALVDGVPTITGETDVTNVAGSPFANGANLARPDFARDSNRLAVQAYFYLPGDSTWNIWILDLADPANPRRLTSPEGRIQPRWCDGDSRIVFNASFRGGSVLWSIDAASGSDLRRLGDRDQYDAACRR